MPKKNGANSPKKSATGKPGPPDSGHATDTGPGATLAPRCASGTAGAA